ncbi:MAG TPA: hypothetical protein VMN60_00045 [Longimicrobiales bacterium]|nr:hypothetical protein [Longimicrobiales bacterium]
MATKGPRKPATRATATRAFVTAVPTLPAWVPPVAYAVVTLLLFYPFLLGGTSALGDDSVALSYFARNFYTEFIQNFHRMPYWNPLLFGGMPFVEGMHGDIFYPPSLALFFMDARVMWGWKMALHIFLAGSFTYLWLHRGLKLDRLPAFFGGLVFMMGANLVTLLLPGGDGKLFVSALAPLIFWLAERAVSRQRIGDFALFALGIALILFTSHMQAAYYCVWGVSLYFLFRVWQLWRGQRSGVLAARLVGMYALAGVLGVGAAAIQFLPPLEYLRAYSHRAERAQERGYEWSSTYSLHAEEIASLVVPEFVGDVVEQRYWGRNGFKLNHEYTGFVALFLVPVLLLRRRTAQTWFFIALAVLTLLYALASSTPAGRLFYLIPGVSLFRSWSIIIFLFGLAAATLGALAVQRLQTTLVTPPHADEAGVIRRYLWIGAGAFALLALLASTSVLLDSWTAIVYRGVDAPFPGSDVTPRQVLDTNIAYIRNGFWITCLLAAAVAGTWEMAVRGLLSPRALVFALALIAALDLYRVDRSFVQATAARNVELESVGAGLLFRPDDTIEQLQRLRDAGGVFRALDYAYGMKNVLAVHGIEQIGGHHGNEIGRYRNLIGGDNLANLAASELRLLDVTNTEYLILSERIADPRFEEVYVGRYAALYRNTEALPRAYVVGRTEVVTDDNAALTRLLAADFDRRNTAILAQALPADAEPAADVRGTVEWVERDVDAYTLRVVVDRPALLVVLDNYYPAWQAAVDGTPAPIHRANHTFRAIAVPAGEHTVTFRYEASALRSAALISLFVLALLLAVVAVDAWRARRRVEPVPVAA